MLVVIWLFDGLFQGSRLNQKAQRLVISLVHNIEEQYEIYTGCPMKFCFWNFYEVTRSEIQISETTLWSKTFDFTYWGTFSAQNSEVFGQTIFFSVFKNRLTN